MLEEPTGTQRLFNDVRDRIAAVFQQSAPGDNGSLMTGLVTGDDSALSPDARSAFLATGTTHITAVSGTNFAVLVAVAAALGRRAGIRGRLRWIAAVTAIVWFYAVLVGLPPSALRAALMATCALFAVRIGRRPDFLTLLVVCGAIQLAFRPGDLQTLSFQLSFASTLALILVFSGNTLWSKHIAASLALTAAAAYLATTPILAYQVGELGFATIPTNVAIGPLVIIAFPLALLAGAIGLFAETIGIVLAWPASQVTLLILSVVEGAGKLLPGTASVGSVTGVSFALLAVVSWGAVMLLSRDIRLCAERSFDWFRGQPSAVQAACCTAVAVAGFTIGWRG